MIIFLVSFNLRLKISCLIQEWEWILDDPDSGLTLTFIKVIRSAVLPASPQNGFLQVPRLFLLPDLHWSALYVKVLRSFGNVLKEGVDADLNDQADFI